MLGDILLKLVNSLTPDDVRQLKVAGYEAELRALLGVWDAMAMRWRADGVVGRDRCRWSVVPIKLNELRAALRG